MTDIGARINQSVRRGAMWVFGLAIGLAIAWIAFFTGDIISAWDAQPLRSILLILIPLAVIGSLVHRARAVSRFEFTHDGIRLRSTREFQLRWTDVVRYDIGRHALLLYLRDGRRHAIDLYVVNDASLVREGVLSLVPESAHRGEPT